MVTVIAHLKINDEAPQQLGKYFEITTLLMKKAGAKIVRRYQTVSPVIGSTTNTTVVIVEYPSREAVHAVFGSDAYLKARPYRDAAFHEYQISVCECEEMDMTKMVPATVAD